MGDYAVYIDLPEHKRGDRWPGILSIGPVTIDGQTPAEALARMRMHLVMGAATFRLDSDPASERDAEILIVDAAAWRAAIPPVSQFVPAPGKWAWDMEFYAAGQAAPLTLYRGTLLVLDDVTK